MSNLAHPKNKDDYPAAARKHLRDAAALTDAGRFDGAGYLAGYAVECSLQTVIMVGAYARRARLPPGGLRTALAPGSANLRKYGGAVYGDVRGVSGDHDLDALATATTTYAQELNAENVNYAPAIDRTQAPFHGAWTHKLRYRAEGAVAEADARAWVTAAEALYASSVGLMMRDGVIVL
ncbi:hypothetical protein WME94_43850 [Sorangium sp. So ce429]